MEEQTDLTYPNIDIAIFCVNLSYKVTDSQASITCYYRSMLYLAIFAGLFLMLKETCGHGLLLYPPSRSSMWRYDNQSPVNLNDNEIFCGGVDNHWIKNEGKCGVCGDDYLLPRPRANENTGFYGRGKIAANYTAGKEDEMETEECFKYLLLEDGTDIFYVKAGENQIKCNIKLPDDFRCPHCVLRWEYIGGSNYGLCKNDQFLAECGAQEVFRNCADIRIV